MAKTGIPSSATSAAATSSWVERGLEAHDVVDLRCRDLEDDRVLERTPAMDRARLDAKGMAGADHLDVERPARITHLQLDPALVDLDDFVLEAVELEAQLLVLAD